MSFFVSPLASLGVWVFNNNDLSYPTRRFARGVTVL